MMTGLIAHALLASAWQGMVIAAALWCALRIVPHERPQVRYLLSLGALAAMLGCFLAGLVPGGAVVAARVSSPAGGVAFSVWFWTGGVVAIASYRVAGWALLRYRVRECTAPALVGWMELAEGLRWRMGMTGNVSLLRADWLPSPAVYGVLKPVILIPAAAVAGLPPEQFEAVLAHELAHILRRDYLANLLQTVAETLLFHHPAAWWIGRQIRQERECCCDQLAARAVGNGLVLAHALLAMEEHRGAAPVLAATGGQLRTRIERLAGVHRPARLSATALLAIAALALVAHVVAFQEGLGGPYGKWLNEDVLYIIQPEERKAFAGLRSDAERERFIEQFWKRRDPTPDTQENEAKEEHYRRISYANGRFGESNVSGWKTERGRVYILNGPPDEIMAWPSKMLERWIYRAKEDKPREELEFLDGKLKRN